MVFIILVDTHTKVTFFLCILYVTFFSIYKFAWYVLGYIQYMRRMKI